MDHDLWTDLWTNGRQSEKEVSRGRPRTPSPTTSTSNRARSCAALTSDASSGIFLRLTASLPATRPPAFAILESRLLLSRSRHRRVWEDLRRVPHARLRTIRARSLFHPRAATQTKARGEDSTPLRRLQARRHSICHRNHACRANKSPAGQPLPVIRAQPHESRHALRRRLDAGARVRSVTVIPAVSDRDLRAGGGTEARHQRRTGLEARSAAVFSAEVASIADAQSP